MKRSEIKILIVEDDKSQGKAIEEALKRTGFDPRWVMNGDDALKQIRQTDYKLVIMDCLLPKTNGVELANQLKLATSDDLKLILMSGIYRDKGFIKDATTKTQAQHFLSKPLDIEAMLTLVDETLGDILEPDLPALMESLTQREVPQADRLKALSQSHSLHGYDLPLVYSLIFDSSLSGNLNILNSHGDASILSFHSGRLTQVQLKDSTSYFGVLLVEMGFTSHEEVSEILTHQDKNPIGERLVAAHSLSPHAIRVVREEQMLIRLSKTVQDTFVDVNFIPQETANADVSLDRDRFTQLLWDWISSKISMDWLRSYYSKWLEYPIITSDRLNMERRLGILPGVQGQIIPLFKLLGEGRTLAEILDSSGLNEERIYSSLHLLLLEKIVYFGPRKSSQEDNQRRIVRLKKLLADTTNKDFYELLGCQPRSQEKDITRNYMELAKNFHPDRLEAGASQEIRKLTEQYFKRVTEAYETLKDPTRRAGYTRELHEGSAEKVLQNESLFEQGQIYLKKGKFQLALENFAKIASQRHHRNDLNIYLAWSKMKATSPDQKAETFLSGISELLNKVPPEERHSAPYFYTKALFYMQLGDYEKSKTNYKHALALDPNFMEARRELAVVRSRLAQKADSLGELSSVVANIFGRKKAR